MEKFLIGGIALAFMAAPAAATQCVPYEGWKEFLSKGEYKEKPMLKGEAGRGGIWRMELWVNVDTGTWTVLKVRNKGDNLACGMMSGNQFAPMVHEDVKQGDPA